MVSLTLPLLVALIGPQTLDLSKPEVRRMVLQERRGMNCGGLYQQTRAKFEGQLKALNKIEGAVKLDAQTLATMTEITTALGQKRREFCEFYKSDPEFTKQDYFKAFGAINEAESDIGLLLRVKKGVTPASALEGLKTVAPPTGGEQFDVNQKLREVMNATEAATARILKVEQTQSLLQVEQQRQASELGRLRAIADPGPPHRFHREICRNNRA